MAPWLNCLLLQPHSAGKRKLIQCLTERITFEEVEDEAEVAGERISRSIVYCEIF